MDNLHGRIPRKICVDVLDQLTGKKHLTCKEYGKAKIYILNQSRFPETSKDELAVFDDQIAVKKKILGDKETVLKGLQQGK